MGPKMDPKIDPKIAQNARKARLRSGTLPGCILGSFLVDFWGRFGTLLGSFFGAFWHNFQQFLRVCTNTRRYKQKGAKTHKIRANAGRYLQIRADTCKYAQIRAGTRTYVQKRANTWKHIQIHTDTRKYRVERIRQAVTRNCRERHSAACGDTCLQVWLWSRASRSLTRQVFKRGSKRCSFSASILDLGTYFGHFFEDFQCFLALVFWLWLSCDYVRFFGQFMCPWMCQNDVFTTEKQLFSWICMF